MVQNDIDNALDQLRMIKNRGDLSSVKIYQVERLERELRFLRTFIKYNHVLLPKSLVKITNNAKTIVKKLGKIPYEFRTNINVERLVSQLQEFVEGNTSSMCNFELNDSDLMKYMDYLDKNLNDSLRCLFSEPEDYWSKEMKIHKKQLTFIQKKMRFQRYIYGTEINGYVNHEKLKGLQTQIQLMAETVGHFYLSLWDDEDYTLLSCPLCLIVLVELEMKKIFLGELKASKFTQSKTFRDKKLPKGFPRHLHSLLVYLRNKKLKNFVSSRNIGVAIEFLLVFLGDVPNHVINGKRLNEILAKIGVLVGDILCVIQMLLAGSTIKEDVRKIDLGTIQILEKIEDLKAEVEERYKSLRYSLSNELPSGGGLSFLDSLLRKLNKMLKSESSLDFMMKSHIGILDEDLSYLTSVFGDVAKVQHEHDDILKDLQRRTVNLAYEAEVSIDSILVQYNALLNFFCTLPAIIKESKQIRAKVKEMRFQNLPLKPFSVIEPSKHLPTPRINPVNDEEIVGFENEAEKIIQYLIRDTHELDVVPIVGMGGQGKTTIARKVYNNGSIVHHFDVRAWCIISQTCNRRELLQDIFSQVTGSKDKGDEDDILADKLRKSLMGKRYLIVLDDMWDGKAWDDLRLSFPDVGKRSRIVVTTRLEEVAKQVKHHIDPYSLPFLTPDESLKLLQKKVFQQETCPPALQHVSQAVAERCKGLPLVIVLVAGIIKRNKMEASWWYDVKNSLVSYLDESEGYSLSTMQLSYNNLPDHLRPCLLYMGMFPEDAIIPVSKLIRLWIAECFVQNIESGRLEETAEGYLNDLISSNVVMVSSRRYNGKVKHCQVHDVVLHFCLKKRREEKFMVAVKGNLNRFQSSHLKERRVSFSFSNELFSVNSMGSKSFRQRLRSVIMTYDRNYYDKYPFLQVISDMSLVKVLDLNCTFVELPSDIFIPLIHLKYLSVYSVLYIHWELHLPHLETLIVKRTVQRCADLPKIFWKMEKLRHVEIPDNIVDWNEDKQGMFDESSKLENLRIFKGGLFKKADNLEVFSRRCPNLQQLNTSFLKAPTDDSGSKDDNDAKPLRIKLESLSQLQSLELSFPWSPVLGLHLPSNLKKLGLHCLLSIESVISFIAGLPSLEYLQLTFCRPLNWCLPTDIKFHKLKFLKLVGLYILTWDMSEESLPQLETLSIIGCVLLKEIPLNFADIPTLKQIKLIQSGQESLEASAVRIKEAVIENEGNDRIDLITKDTRRR